MILLFSIVHGDLNSSSFSLIFLNAVVTDLQQILNINAQMF